MAERTLAGTPFLRYPDPLVKRVSPLGLQPQNAFTATLLYGDPGQPSGFNAIINEPPGAIALNMLLFGSDYPISVSGTQTYLTNNFLSTTTSATPVPNLITDMSFPLLDIPPIFFASPNSPNILNTNRLFRYQEKMVGTTITNGVEVTGFPVLTVISSHNLYAQAVGPTPPAPTPPDPPITPSPFASYAVSISAILNGAIVNGPASYVDAVSGELGITFPVIMYERDFTQKMADDGYTVTYTEGGITAVLDIVGLWGSSNYVPPATTVAAVAMAMSDEPPVETSPLQQALSIIQGRPF
jgi:hypothetical protein